MKKWMQAALAVAAGTSMVALNGCTSDYTYTVPTPPTTFTQVYGAVRTFDSNDKETDSIIGVHLANGVASPQFSISGPVTGYDSTTGIYQRVRVHAVAADGSGNAYALIDAIYHAHSTDNNTAVPAESNGDREHIYAIVKFAKPSGYTSISDISTIDPSTAITSSALRYILDGDEPAYLGLDNAGNFYAAGGNGAVVFPASAMGTSNAEPSVSLTGEREHSDLGIAYVDGAGNLYLTRYSFSNDNDEVEVYAAGFTTGAEPTATFTLNHGADFAGIWADSTGKVYLTDYNYDDDNYTPTVDVVAAGASGVVTPAQSIAGSSTNLIEPTGIAVDSTGKIFVEDVVQSNEPLVRRAHPSTATPHPADDVDSSATMKVLQFASTATGNVAPAATFTSSATGVYSFSIK